MDYGTDFRLLDDDMVFTPDGDAEIVAGPACVAQDIDQTLKTAPGRLVWDKEAGSALMLMLNDAGSAAVSVIEELDRVAIADPRVDPVTVAAKQKDGKTYRLEFSPMGAVAQETLEYDIAKRDMKNG
jgi:phage baseplate assembly protein W